jgi:hypothetical protein
MLADCGAPLYYSHNIWCEGTILQPQDKILSDSSFIINVQLWGPSIQPKDHK